MAEIVFLNGKFIPPEEAKLTVSTPGFLYGWGLFETMRAYHNRIVYFDAHLRRLRESCYLVDIKCPYSLAKLKTIIRQTVKINGFSDAQVRLTLWKAQSGADILITVKKYRPYSANKEYKNGFRACVSSFKQNENFYLARLKTTNYLLYRLAYVEAKDKGFDEAIILNNRGYLTEGSRANIFLFKDRELWTPALGCGCLNGITRKVIFDLAKKYHLQASESNLTLSDLYAADEAFFTNSLLGIMPLAAIEKHRIGQGVSRYKITPFLMQKYQYLLKNATEKNKITF
jgi:branched-subunit amino acid aminotransferase/4-amino-4-deoxychorismate lyase